MPSSSVMKVMQLGGLGGPDRFTLSQLPKPIPGPDEFLVKVSHCGICGHDVLARDGRLRAQAGHVLGHEISGTVVEVGSPVLNDWLDCRVALVQRRPCGSCRDCHERNPTYCRTGPGFYGDEIQGGYSQFVIAGPLNAIRLPQSIPGEIGAILSCAVGTGLRALRRAHLSASDVVLITGAGGGVGVHTVALAAHRGLRVIAATSTASRVDELKEQGADVVLVRPTEDEVRRAAKEFDRPRGPDGVIELTGSPTFELSLRSIRPGGVVVVVGNVDPVDVPLPLGLTIVKELKVIGSANADVRDLAEVVDLVESRQIRPLVSKIYNLEEVNQAHLDLDARKFPGRLVLSVGP